MVFSKKSLLSQEEEFFSKFITRMGCISYKQGEYLLATYFECSPNMAERVFHSLYNKGYMTIYPSQYDKQYILAGGALVHEMHPISRPLVESLWIALDCFDENQDGLSDIKGIRRKEDEEGIFFISGDDSYQTTHVTEQDFLSKINMQEQIYLQNRVDTVTIFIFSNGAHMSYILEQLNGKNYQMPGNLVFIGDDDILDKPKYHIEVLPGID